MSHSTLPATAQDAEAITNNTMLIVYTRSVPNLLARYAVAASETPSARRYPLTIHWIWPRPTEVPCDAKSFAMSGTATFTMLESIMLSSGPTSSP